MIDVCVYKDLTNLFTEKEIETDGNLTEIVVPDELLRRYFMEWCLESFRSDEELNNEALYEEWLDEFTADDTEDFVDFLSEQGYEIGRVNDRVGSKGKGSNEFIVSNEEVAV